MGRPLRYISGHQRRKSPIEYIEQDCGFTTPCWVWQRATSSNGYGRGYANGITCQAHRMVYERMIGSIPDGLDLDHLCRNRACVNPEHLEPVTRLVNVARGTNPVLTMGLAEVIRTRYAGGGCSQRQLAAEYGVCHATIGGVTRRQRYKGDLEPGDLR